jgi:hypothetical protein
VGPLALLLASAVCMGAPVRESSNGSLSVQAGPFVGGVTAYERVAGRFALRVGPNRAKGLFQKIPWFPAPGTAIGGSLVVTGKALSLPHRSFTQTFTAAQEVGGQQRTMFPSILAPPSAGCWLLTFTSGPTAASIAVRVRPRP